MKTRILLLVVFAPVMLEAQIVLYSLNGITPSPLGAVYGYGQVAAGDSKDVRFRALNTGTASVTITCLKVTNTAGAGFSKVNTSSTPFVVAPGNGMDFFIRFSATEVTSYSATLQVGTGTTTATEACIPQNVITAIFLATVVPAPTLSVAAPCTGPDSNATIGFGRIPQGTQQTCTLTILNPFVTALTVAPLNVTGTAFTTTSGNAVTIAAGQSASFNIQFSAAAATGFSGTLTVGTRVYTLSGTGFSSPLPPLVWSFDTSAISSGEQHTLTVQLSAPSPVTASGSVILTFTPSIATVVNDSVVQFVATSKRLASFTVNTGEIAIKLNGQPNIVFSTGTTAGKITFTVDSGIYGITGNPSTSVVVVPTLVTITSSSASSRLNHLEVVLDGFDNTYSMGGMSFSFYDRSGRSIAIVPADFAPNFNVFFQNQTTGSSFRMGVSFPVSGDVTQVGGVEVLLNNAAGGARTPRLNFP